MTLRLSADRIQAHRGASAACPENTMAAFRAARTAGAGSIETDLTILADGIFCIFHDAELGRTTPGSGRITDLDSATVSTLDAGTWHNSGHENEKVPLLKDALAFQAETGIAFNWEVKDQGNVPAAELADAVITQLGEAERELTLVSSFSLPLLKHLQATGFSHRMALAVRNPPLHWRETGADLGLEGFHLDADFLDAGIVAAMQESGFSTRVFTVNSAEVFAECVALGVDTIITDRPEDFIIK